MISRLRAHLSVYLVFVSFSNPDSRQIFKARPYAGSYLATSALYIGKLIERINIPYIGKSTCQMEAFISNKSTTCAQGLRETLLHVLPVDHIPDRLEVFGLAVLVLQAADRLAETTIQGNGTNLLVSVLPSINTKERLELTDNGVLVL